MLSLQVGVLQAPLEVIQRFGVASDVPTLHVEVLAVREAAHGHGYGRRLIEHALAVALSMSQNVGIKTLSLEATEESAAFYRALGFDEADSPWPDGSMPMWFVQE